MSREFAKMMPSRYKADGINFNEVLPLKEQRAFVQNLNTERTRHVSEGMDDEEDNSDLESMVAAEGVATSGIRGNLREVHRVCESGGKAVPMSIVEVIGLAQEGVEAKRENATMSIRQTNLKAELVKIRTALRTMSNQIPAALERLKYLKGRLVETRLAFEKLTDETSRAEAKL